MNVPDSREHRRGRPRVSAEGLKKGEDRDPRSGVHMVMVPIRWVSLLIAMSLVVAAFPGFSQTLPGADGLENDTGETSEDTNLTTIVDETSDTLGETTNTTDDPGSDGLNDTLDGTPLPGDQTGEGLVDATASCLAHESGDGRLVCTAPPSCQDQLYRTPACMPPPQCIDQGNHTFECYPRDQLDRVVDAGQHVTPWSSSPACLPSPHAWDTVVCQPPDHCLGDLAATQACRPAPGCQLDESVYVCRPTQDPSSDDPSRDLPGSSETLDLIELGREVQALTRTSMDTFRSALDQLRTTYETGLDEIRAAYGADKATARQAYLTCLEDAGEDAPARQACQDTAREQLEALRAEAREEEQALRERLLDRAETLRAGICQHLATQGQALISQASGPLRLEDTVDVGKLSLCQDELAALDGS